MRQATPEVMQMQPISTSRAVCRPKPGPDTGRRQCKNLADTTEEPTWSCLQARARCKGPDAHNVQACLLRKAKQLLHWVVLASLVLSDHGLCSLVQVSPAAGSAAAVSLVRQSGVITARVRPLAAAQPWSGHAPPGKQSSTCIS